MYSIKVNNIPVHVIKKNIKNLHLSVNPPDAKVKLSSPMRLKKNELKFFILSRLNWIKEKRNKILNQPKLKKIIFENNEKVSLFGTNYKIKILISNKLSINLINQKLIYKIKENSSYEKLSLFFNVWLRDKLKNKILFLTMKWQKMINVKCSKVLIRKMKTKWGSCNTKSKAIIYNAELAHKKTSLIEYIVVHELIHLLERKHNHKFYLNLDKFLPDWQSRRIKLNSNPLSFYTWSK